MDVILSNRPAIAQRAFWLILLLVFIAVGISYTAKILKSQTASAFQRQRAQVLSLEDANVYEQSQYPYPPIMAILLRPLALIEPPVAGALAWFLLKVGMAAFSLWAIFRIIEQGGMPFPAWAKAATVLLSLRPLIGDLSHGNVNIFILFLVIASLFAFHKGRDWLAGLFLALAICCKVTPLLFVPYFLWKRQWKLLAGCAAGMGLFLIAVPAIFLGWNENLTKLGSWADQMVLPFVRDGVVSSEHPNQSLPGVVHRLLTHNPSFSAYPNGVYTPTEYHNLTDIGQTGARWLVRGGQGLFVLLVVLLCRTPARMRGGWRLSLEFAMIAVGMLIFSERTWKHHCVTLALPFAVLLYSLATQPLSKTMRTILIAPLAMSMALMLSSSGLVGTRAADLAQVYGVYLWAFIILLAACVVAGLHGDNRSMNHLPSASR